MLPIRRLALSQRSAFLLRPTASLVARRTYAEGSFQDLKARILDQEPSNAGHPGPLRPRPARDDMSADEAEQAQEDLTDTAMVRPNKTAKPLGQALCWCQNSSTDNQ